MLLGKPTELTSTVSILDMDGPLGFEPRSSTSKAEVLPLDDKAILEEGVGFEPTDGISPTV